MATRTRVPSKPSRSAARDAAAAVRRAEGAVRRAKSRLEALRRAVPPEPVRDYAFREASGRTVRLSRLFGRKPDLVVVHNMGTRCPMCTAWADGFDGVARHLEDRAAFVVTSPDPVPVQRAFARKRGWRFRMVSSQGTSFFGDMGFASEDGHPWPGISVFWKDPKGRLYRVAHAGFGPGDDFSPLFGVLPLLRGGQGEWWPSIEYRARRGGR